MHRREQQARRRGLRDHHVQPRGTRRGQRKIPWIDAEEPPISSAFWQRRTPTVRHGLFDASIACCTSHNSMKITFCDARGRKLEVAVDFVQKG
jgi:hypothetical protein